MKFRLGSIKDFSCSREGSERPQHTPSAIELTQVYGSNQTTEGEGCDWLSLLKKEFPKFLADLVYHHLNVEQ